MPENCPAAGTLKLALDECSIRDLARFNRLIKNARNQSSELPSKLVQEIETAAAKLAARRANVPHIEFPENLPIAAKREEIAEAIIGNQVVVVCGETGSGKTTQLPKICLSLGRGIRGAIGHTQPRRIAARSVASRIAEELNSEVGGCVGYKVRFNERLSDNTLVKLMTDGILLSEMARDPLLLQYDTLILDEAHERSLNIDFLLGYLKQILPKRPDLKLIVTSATIDPGSFSRHFNDAPIIQVSGRSYPVEMRYRPFSGEDDDKRENELINDILAASDELMREGTGDILVFLPGEREIREVADALQKHHLRGVEVLPLYARLSVSEQQKIFQSHAGRRIVLATNVAETSLTVPGIRYVIDSGLARISRYSVHSKVQQLPVEAISQASAQQRAGRCGRVAPGICIRLYEEADFNNRPAFTEPEIRRANLASVILSMRHLRLGEIEDFPFVDPPERRYINDGYKLLEELGAVDQFRQLTRLGRSLAELPVDPRIARMILAGQKEGALHEVLIIASALTSGDPRDRPFEFRQKADEAHRKFADKESDFLSFVKLWDMVAQEGDTQSKLRKLCKTYFLSYVRLREWRDVHRQLQRLCQEKELKENQVAADYSAVHRALLAGLISNIAFREEKNLLRGARGRILSIFPGSVLSAKPPKWIMAAELTETTRLYARTIARIDVKWVESVGAHLLSREYFEPHWEPESGQVGAYERVSLYGLVIVPRRRINYGSVNAKEAREIFIRQALVEDGLASSNPALKHNRSLISELEALEDRARRRDILVDEEALYRFYDERIPEDVHSAAAFNAWFSSSARNDAKALYFSRDELMRHDAEDVTAQRYPKRLELGGLSLPFSYVFEPGTAEDGVTVSVPEAALNQLKEAALEWLVPGFLEEKVIALIRTLPKSLRRNFVPVPEFARASVERLTFRQGSLKEELARALFAMTGMEIPSSAWAHADIDDHLRMRIAVLDESGHTIRASRNLVELRVGVPVEKLPEAKSNGTQYPHSGIKCWDFPPFPERIEVKQGGARFFAFPALVDETHSVAIRLLNSKADAASTTRAGVKRLLMLELNALVKEIAKAVTKDAKLCLAYTGFGKPDELAASVVDKSFDIVFLEGRPVPQTKTEFDQRITDCRNQLMSQARDLIASLHETFIRYRSIKPRVDKLKSRAPRSAEDAQSQLDYLLCARFIETTPAKQLMYFPRYLTALEKRLDKLEQAPEKDIRPLLEITPFWLDLKKRVASTALLEGELRNYRWLIEELRISLFAQPMKSVEPVSIKRLTALSKLIE